jgi:hypothetical protein
MQKNLVELKMKRYDVWMEGYAATGNFSGAEFCGVYEAETFAEACAKWNREQGEPGYFDSKDLTYWGCRFFDNERDARRSFG